MLRFSKSEWISIGVIAGGAIGFALLYFLRELAIAGTAGFPLDDSWIHLVFARNLARGDFFAYNPHVPVAGSTTPLWTVILGIGFFLTNSPIIMPKIIGVLLNVTLGIVVWRFAEFLGLRRFPAVVTSLLAICATRMVWASLSGMEVSLYCLLTVSTAFAYFKYLRSSDWKKYLAWILGGIAVSARPELMMTLVFMIVHQVVMRMQRSDVRKRDKRSTTAVTDEQGVLSISDLAIRVGVFLACSAPYYALNYFLSRSPFPVTFAAKTSNGGAPGLLASGDYEEIIKRSFVALWLATGNAIKWMWTQDNVFLTIIAIIGFLMLVGNAARRKIISLPASALLLIGIQLFLYAPARSVVTGKLDFGQWGRYAAQTTPLIMLFGSVVLCGWLERGVKTASTARSLVVAIVPVAAILLSIYYSLAAGWGRGHQWPSMDWYPSWLHQGDSQYVFLFAGCAAVAAAAGFLLLRRNFTTAVVQGVVLLQLFAFTIVENIQCMDEYAWDVRNIKDTQVALGEWLHDHVPAGTVYATNDIGAMAYYADGMPLVDLIGLVSPAVSHVLAENQSNDKTGLWVIENLHPAYIVCFNEWYPYLVRDGVRAGLLERVHSVAIPNNITSGGKGITAMHIYAVHPERLAGMTGGTVN